MRGTIAKKIRKYTRTRYRYLTEEPAYETLATGQRILAAHCQRALYQLMKKEYTRRSRIALPAQGVKTI